MIAIEYEFIYNPYTGRLDRTRSTNQSGENWTADYFFGNISTATSFQNDTRSATLVVCASDSLDISICNYVADGVSDEVEIELALGALPAGGGKVVLMEGVFTLGNTIDFPKDSITLEGQGEATILNRSNGATTIYIDGKDGITIRDLKIVNATQGIVPNENVNELVITHITTDGVNYGIQTDFMDASTRIEISNSNFFNSQRAINLEDVQDIFIINNLIDTTTEEGIFVSNVYRATISNNKIENTLKAGILNAASNNLISNNIIKSSSSIGILLENGGDDNLIVNNIITTSLRDGITITGDSNIVSGNRIQSSSGYGINITNSAEGSMIMNNNLLGNTATILNNGINSNIYNNYPGGSSMEIQTATGQEIKMIPEGTITQTLFPENTTFNQQTCWENDNLCINNTPSIPGDCPTGYVVQNTTTGGVECISFITTYYNATSLYVESGTVNGGINWTQHSDGQYDGLTLNLTEQAMAPALIVYINFTGVPSFNKGYIRYKTTTLAGDYPLIQLWDYVNLEWENYPTIAESETFAVIEQSVIDNTNHVSGGIVQMRINKSSNGNTNNDYFIDWIAIADGLGTPSGVEVDPFAIHITAINTTQMWYSNLLHINTSWVTSLITQTFIKALGFSTNEEINRTIDNRTTNHLQFLNKTQIESYNGTWKDEEWNNTDVIFSDIKTTANAATSGVFPYLSSSVPYTFTYDQEVMMYDTSNVRIGMFNPNPKYQISLTLYAGVDEDGNMIGNSVSDNIANLTSGSLIGIKNIEMSGNLTIFDERYTIINNIIVRYLNETCWLIMPINQTRIDECCANDC